MAEKKTAPAAEYATAMDKLRDEMAKNSGRRYVQVVGEFLTGYLMEHPEAEAAILDKGKSIAGSLTAMRKEAEKVKEGNVAVLDDQTAFGIVLGYFGIKGDDEAVRATRTSSVSGSAGATFPRGEGLGGMADFSKSLPPVGKVPPKGADGVSDTPAPADPFDLDALLGVM